LVFFFNNKINFFIFFLYSENIKRQAYLVLEENKVLQEQLDLQTNRLTDVQKSQIQEGKNFISYKNKTFMIALTNFFSFN
jgi:hypothetical protein